MGILKKSILVTAMVAWMLMYIFMHIGSVMSTPDQTVFMHINKITKLYALNSEYRAFLYNTKFTIKDKICQEEHCDVNVAFIAPHPLAPEKLTHWTTTIGLTQTKRYGWMFDQVLTERDIMKYAGNQSVDDAVRYEREELNYIDTILWTVTFIISLVIAPFLFVLLSFSAMFEKRSGWFQTGQVFQLLLATYLNIYVSSNLLSEFQIYADIVNWY